MIVFICVLSECCCSEFKELSCLTSHKGGEERREVHLGSLGATDHSNTNTWVHIREKTSPRTPYLGYWWGCMNSKQSGTAEATYQSTDNWDHIWINNKSAMLDI